jgi:hypothetical protein
MTGGVVFIDNNGIFNLSGGIICDNEGPRNGGGVGVKNAAFNMTGGTISGNFGGEINSSYSSGGGGVVLEENGDYSMSNWIISGNTAVSENNGRTCGGGVCVWELYTPGIFIKSEGGTIDDTNSAQKGKVVCIWSGREYGENPIRNTTAGPSVNMNSAIAGSAGGWEE